jgi:hypothetical protein
LRRVLIVFEDQLTLVRDAERFKPGHSKTQTLIRNGSVYRYQTPDKVVDLVSNELGLKGMKPDKIEIVGILGRGMRKAVEILEAQYCPKREAGPLAIYMMATDKRPRIVPDLD